MPKNITPIFLPSRSPELNPQENIWQYMRANWLSRFEKRSNQDRQVSRALPANQS
jgi:transposase